MSSVATITLNFKEVPDYTELNQEILIQKWEKIYLD